VEWKRDESCEESGVEWSGKESLVGWERKPEYMPLAFIIALEDGVTLSVEGRSVQIPKGWCFIFKGDLAHQGLGGAMGALLHGYIGTRFHPAAIDY
jgi:hypothetical protein